MPSSLLNDPYPDTSVKGYYLTGQPDGTDRDEKELRARKYYLDLAAEGDAEAKLMLKTHPRWRLSRWWRRGIGEIL